jgi:hypothetical protein
MIFPSEIRLSEKESRQPKRVKTRMRLRKLKVVQIGQAAFEQKAVKQWTEWIEFRKKLLVSSLTDNQRRQHYAPP